MANIPSKEYLIGYLRGFYKCHIKLLKKKPDYSYIHISEASKKWLLDIYQSINTDRYKEAK